MTDPELYNDIRADIHRGATRYRSAEAADAIRRRIDSLRQTSTPLADCLDIALDVEFGRCTREDASRRADEYLTRPDAPPLARLAALVMSARLKLHEEPWEDNRRRRAEALELAEREGLLVERVVISVNWLAAEVERGDGAGEMVARIEPLVALLAGRPSTDTRAHEALSRFASHKAKLLFADAAGAEDDATAGELIGTAMRVYGEAIERERSSDHGRTNLQIEFADCLTEAYAARGLPPLVEAGRVLGDAQESLNAHHCDLCRGYYHQVRAAYADALGDRAYGDSPDVAAEHWRVALEHSHQSVAFYESAKFTTKGVAPITERVTEKMTKAAQPRKIFLSHKSVDKSLVRDFKQTLAMLRFDPWLDEEAMAAGTNLQRALLQGFVDSCAAVFFITPNYIDDGYLATEVDHAIAQKHVKGDGFAIIVLNLPDATGTSGGVPALLGNYVWKTPASHLEALRELIRALPLKVTTPEWKT